MQLSAPRQSEVLAQLAPAGRSTHAPPSHVISPQQSDADSQRPPEMPTQH